MPPAALVFLAVDQFAKLETEWPASAAERPTFKNRVGAHARCAHPRPTNGIWLAITVRNRIFASSGSESM
jgi:hypothetical protein